MDILKAKTEIGTFQIEDTFYRQFIEQLEEGIAIVTTADHLILYCNKRLSNIFKVPVERLVDHSIDEFFKHADLLIFKSVIGNGMKETARSMVTIHTGNDRQSQVFISGLPINSDDQRICLIFSELSELEKFPDDQATEGSKKLIARDRILKEEIDDLKKVEEALQKSEEKFKIIATNTPDHILIQDSDLRYTCIVNPQLGLTEKDMLGKTDFDFLTKEDAINLTKIKKKVLKTGKPENILAPLVAKDGSTQYFEGSYIPKRNSKGEIDGLLGYFRNVTEHKKAEETLSFSEERFRTLAKNVPDQIIRFDRNLRLLYANPAVTNHIGLPLEKLLGRTVHEYGASPASSDLWDKVANEVLELGELRRYEHRSLWQGEVQILDVVIVPEKNADGMVQSVIAIARDITERKQAENKLHYQVSILDSINDAVVATDLSFKITYWNKAAEKIYGYKQEEVMGKLVAEVLKSQMSVKQRSEIYNKLMNGKSVHTNLEQIIKDGRKLITEGYSIPLKDLQKKIIGFVAINKDITESKRMEDEIKMLAKFPSENPSPVLRISREGKILYANASGKELLQIWQCEIGDYVPQIWSNEIKESFASSTQQNIEIELNNKIFSFIIIPVRDEDYVNLYGRDITESIKAEEELFRTNEKLNAILDATQESIFMFDPKGIIVNANAIAAMRLNRSATDVIGQQLSKFIPKEIAETREKHINEVFITGKAVQFEDTRNGIIFVHNFFPVFEKGEVIYVVNYSRDITERRNAAEKLRESMERYQSLVESSPDGVIVHQDGYFVYANSVALQFYGANSLEHLQTKTVLDLIHPDDRDMIKKRMQQGMGGLKVPLVETRLIDFDGKTKYVESIGSRINFQGKPSVQIIIRDISNRKKREAELLKLNQTLKALDKCSQAMVRAKDEFTYLDEVCNIIIKDCDFSMVWIGYAMEDEGKSIKPVAYAGFEKGYLETLNITWTDTERGRGPTGTAIRIGKPSMCTNMQTDPRFAPWREEAIKRGYSSSIAFPLSISDKIQGAITIYSTEINPFTEDEELLLSEIASDLSYGITAIRWRMAQQIAEEQLKKTAAELKELNATKDKFFGIIAHDLRNPFASMLGSAEILSGDPGQFEPDTVKKFAEIMYNAAKSGYSLLENLLEWSRSQTGILAFNPKRINIREIINKNITTMTAMAANKNIQLISDIPGDLEVVADENMLDTILRNLIINAIKFTYSGGYVSLFAEKDENSMSFAIIDTGIGISNEDIGKLFRIDAKCTNIGTAEERGTGLGLLLCKEFVEKHGGKIWVESVLGEGSIFRFTIPLK